MNVCVVIDGEERGIFGVYSSFDRAVEELHKWFYVECEGAEDGEEFHTVEEVKAMIEENRGWGYWQFLELPLNEGNNTIDSWFDLTCFPF